LEEVAIYLNVSVPQVYSLVRSGDLPAVKLGGRGVWRVDRKRLDEYIDGLHEETEKWPVTIP
jgi:excisionase family DNA binding protein